MTKIYLLLATLLALGSCGYSRPRQDAYKNAYRFEKRATGNSTSLQVDLGYSVYNGYSNTTSGLNIWKGLVLHVSLMLLHC